jgi:hypothetical protein
MEIEPFNTSNLPAKLSDYQNSVMGCMVTFNQLRAFKLDKLEAIGWMNTISRIRPELPVPQLRMAIDGMISGAIPYDEKIGIKNIFKALERVVPDEDKPGQFKTLKPIM